jgi:hypothetical protein
VVSPHKWCIFYKKKRGERGEMERNEWFEAMNKRLHSKWDGWTLPKCSYCDGPYGLLDDLGCVSCGKKQCGDCCKKDRGSNIIECGGCGSWLCADCREGGAFYPDDVTWRDAYCSNCKIKNKK